MSNLAAALEGVPEITKTTQDLLKKAHDENSHDEYRKLYNVILKDINPNIIVEAGENTIEVKAATNGAVLGHRQKNAETNEEIEQKLEDLRDTHEVLTKMGLKNRLSLMQAFEDAVMPKINDALATMITVNVGKSQNAADGEMTKAAAWFGFAKGTDVQNMILDYKVQTGFHVRGAKGQDITEIEQLTETILATKYPNTINVPLPTPQDNGEIKGNGISFSQPPKNYPFALGISDIILSMTAGNATIMKLPADMQDIFDTFSNLWNEHIYEYAQEHQQEIGLNNADLEVLSKRSAVYTTTSYGMEKYANNARVVSSMGVGKKVFDGYQNSKHNSETDKKRFIAELAGSNVLYIGNDLTPDEYETCADKWLGRVIDNNGMICTKIEDGMIKQGENTEAFINNIRKKFQHFDQSAIGNPHDPDTKHGVHTDPESLNKAIQYLNECRNTGAEVIGGKRLSGNTMSPAIVIWPENQKPVHLEQRAKNLENFAPITNLMVVKDVEEAINITNKSQCNLTCSIWTHDANDIGEFINGTDIGSYNVANPKHGSDNAPYGEHMAVYKNVTWIDDNGEEQTLHIENNGPTGGLSHIAHHLDVEPQYAENTTSITAGLLDEKQTILTLIKTGVDFNEATKLGEEKIQHLSQKHNIALDVLAPSLKAA